MPDCKKLYVTFIFAVLWLNISGQVSVDSENQNIRLEPGQYQLEQLFEEISLQTGLFFTYNASILDKKSKQEIPFDSISLYKLLLFILQPKNLDYALIDRNIVIYPNSISFPDNPEKREALIVKGEIRDRKNLKPLSFATIALNETNMGGLANEEGRFSFRIPADIDDPILVFSMLGYENQYYVVKESGEKLLDIRMEPRYISLQEVLIRYIDPLEMVKQSIEKIKENYHQQSSMLTAYFREITMKNKSVMTFAEAALEIEKPPYNISANREKVRLLKGRKIVDAGPEDSLILKIKSGIYSALQLDIIKHQPAFLYTGFEEIYNFTFRDITSFRNRLVYVIEFEQKENIKIPQYKGLLYIDQESLAIVAADFEIHPDYIDKAGNSFFIRKSRKLKTRLQKANYRIEYSRVNGEYLMNLSRTELSFKFRKKNKWFSSNYNIVIELAVTDADFNPDNSISRQEVFNSQSILSDQKLPSDPDYWKDYQIILPDENLEQAVRRMGLEWSIFEIPAEENE